MPWAPKGVSQPWSWGHVRLWAALGRVSPTVLTAGGPPALTAGGPPVLTAGGPAVLTAGGPLVLVPCRNFWCVNKVLMDPYLQVKGQMIIENFEVKFWEAPGGMRVARLGGRRSRSRSRSHALHAGAAHLLLPPPRPGDAARLPHMTSIISRDMTPA